MVGSSSSAICSSLEPQPFPGHLISQLFWPEMLLLPFAFDCSLCTSLLAAWLILQVLPVLASVSLPPVTLIVCLKCVSCTGHCANPSCGWPPLSSTHQNRCSISTGWVNLFHFMSLQWLFRNSIYVKISAFLRIHFLVCPLSDHLSDNCTYGQQVMHGYKSHRGVAISSGLRGECSLHPGIWESDRNAVRF